MLEWTKNALDPYHWTLISYFGAFLSVWVHLGLFPYCTKLGAKRAKLVQLMQKFVQRCLVRIFRNERSWSTPWTLNSFFGAFLSVWVHLEPFHYCTKLCAKWANLVQLMPEFVHKVSSEFLETDAPDPHNWTLSSCFHAFLSVWVHLGPLCYCTNLMQNIPNWCN